MTPLLMEGIRKKRKINNHITDDDTDNNTDEVKIERFFALLRNVKDIRDRLLESQENKDRDNNKKRFVVAHSNTKTTTQQTITVHKQKDHHQQQHVKVVDVEIWQPTFKPEDFEGNKLVDSNNKRDQNGYEDKDEEGGGMNKKKGEDDDDHNKTGKIVLDLNLSL